MSFNTYQKEKNPFILFETFLVHMENLLIQNARCYNASL